MNFKEWLNLQEMAVGDIIRSKCVPMDQDDINYLTNFGKDYDIGKWKTKLVIRYNYELKAALDRDGNVKEDYTDNIGIRKVVEKLKKLGYDLRNNPKSENLAGMQLMKPHNAIAIIYGTNKKLGWVRWSAMQLKLPSPEYQHVGGLGRGSKIMIPPKDFYLIPQPSESTPDMSLWCPNWSKPESFRDINYKPGGSIYAAIRKDAILGVEEILELFEKVGHFNFQKMFDNKDKLIDMAIKDLLNNTRLEEFRDSAWRIKHVKTFIRSLSQKDFGVGSRSHQKLRSPNLSPAIIVRRGKGRPNKDDMLTIGPTSTTSSGPPVTTQTTSPEYISSTPDIPVKRGVGRPMGSGKPRPTSSKTSIKWSFRDAPQGVDQRWKTT